MYSTDKLTSFSLTSSPVIKLIMPAFGQENCSCVRPARKTGQGIVHYVTVCCEHRRQGKFVHGQPYTRAKINLSRKTCPWPAVRTSKQNLSRTYCRKKTCSLCTRARKATKEFVKETNRNTSHFGIAQEAW